MNINQESNTIIQTAINQLNAQKQSARATAYSVKYAELKPMLDKSVTELKAQQQKAVEEVNARFAAEIKKVQDGAVATANKYADQEIARYDVKISQLKNMIEG